MGGKREGGAVIAAASVVPFTGPNNCTLPGCGCDRNHVIAPAVRPEPAPFSAGGGDAA